MIDVQWHGRALTMFVLDLDNRGIEIKASDFIGKFTGVLVNEGGMIVVSGVTLAMVTNTSGILTVDGQPSFARDHSGKTFGFRGGYLNPGQKFEISILNDGGAVAMRPKYQWSQGQRKALRRV